MEYIVVFNKSGATEEAKLLDCSKSSTNITSKVKSKIQKATKLKKNKIFPILKKNLKMRKNDFTKQQCFVMLTDKKHITNYIVSKIFVFDGAVPLKYFLPSLKDIRKIRKIKES